MSRRHLPPAIALLGLLLAVPSAGAVAPGELYPVSGTPGSPTFLPGRANDAWLSGRPDSTTFLGSENTRKLSNDARYVVFMSTADALSPDDDDRFQNIYVHDRDTNAVTLVNVPAPGGTQNADADEPVISGNGRVVAFSTSAPLSPQDTDTTSDIYVRDLDAGTTRLVSITAGGVQGTGGCSQPDLSEQGQHVSYTSAAQLVAADTDDTNDIYETTISNLAIKLISRATGAAGVDANGSASDSAISANGGAVSFTTTATNLDAADTTSGSDVYLRSGTNTFLVSRATGAGGAKGNGQSVDSAISADGKQVAFVSTSTNLAAPDASGVQSVFLRDTDPAALTTILVSRQSSSDGGASANEVSTSPTISQASGTVVAFTSEASNLAAEASSATIRAWRRTVATSTTALVSRTDGAAGAPVSVFGSASLASSGTAVAFQSHAANLSSEDDDHFTSVFVRDGATTALRSRPIDGTAWRGGMLGATTRAHGAVSADGSVVAFVAPADMYGPAANAFDGVFVRNLRTGEITAVSRLDGADGTIFNGSQPQVSADGTKVLFESTAPLAPGVPPNVVQVYLRDLVANTTRLVSQIGGVPANSQVRDSRMSPDGRFVVYSTAATNLGAAITQSQVFRTDLQTGETILVSRQSGAAGAPAVASSGAPAVSADGSKVVFSSSDTTLDPADADSNPSVFLRDVATGSTRILSRADGGGPNDAWAGDPLITSDGSKVVFASDAKNLAGGEADEQTDLFAANVASGEVARITAPWPEAMSPGVDTFALSADGSTVAFTTRHRLLPEDTDVDINDLYAKPATAGGPTTLVGRKATGAPLDGIVGLPSLSADGGCVAFTLGGTGSYGDGPLVSPELPGTAPSPDFSTVLLRGLSATCVPALAPPAAPGSGGGGSAAAKDTVAPILSKVSLSNTRFRRSSKRTATSARLAAAPAKLGTTVRFTLSEAATVRLLIEQRAPGRRVGQSCKKPSPKLRAKPTCTRYVQRGTLIRKNLPAGASTVAFSGRIDKRALALGAYRLTLVATDAAGNASAPRRLAFTIVRR